MSPKPRKIKTAKDILLGKDFLDQQAKSQQYVHHEFQDYAYRLAVDLGDVEHKAIYMRLAKTVPRHLLEQAKAFAKDYDQSNKGKIFMWKLKDLREELQLRRDNLNFDTEFIWQRMGKLYDRIETALIRKYRADAEQQHLNEALQQLIGLVQQVELPGRARKHKLTCLDVRAGYPLEVLSPLGRIDGFTPSSSLYQRLKQQTNSVKTVLPTADRYSDKYLSGMFVGNYWSWIGIDCQQDWLDGWNSKLLSGSGILVKVTTGRELQQQWRELPLGEEEVEYSIDLIQPDIELVKLFESSGFDIYWQDTEQGYFLFRAR